MPCLWLTKETPIPTCSGRTKGLAWNYTGQASSGFTGRDTCAGTLTSWIYRRMADKWGLASAVQMALLGTCIVLLLIHSCID